MSEPVTQTYPMDPLTKPRSLGGEPMKHSHYLRNLFIFLILLTIILGTALAAFEFGRSYQMNEEQSIRKVDVNESNDETGEDTNNDDESDATLADSPDASADLGLEWIQEEYPNETEREQFGSPDQRPSWIIQRPTTGWTEDRGGLMEGHFSATQEYNGRTYNLEFSYPMTEQGKPESLEKAHEILSDPSIAYKTKTLQVDGVDVLMAYGVAGQSSKAYISETDDRNLSVITVENSDEAGDVLLERFVTGLEL